MMLTVRPDETRSSGLPAIQEAPQNPQKTGVELLIASNVKSRCYYKSGFC